MSTIADEQPVERSWMERARLDDAAGRYPGGGNSATVSPSPHGANQGWDPYEVWLSRIERPRRRRVNAPAV